MNDNKHFLFLLRTHHIIRTQQGFGGPKVKNMLEEHENKKVLKAYKYTTFGSKYYTVLKSVFTSENRDKLRKHQENFKELSTIKKVKNTLEVHQCSYKSNV